ncbi:MAG: ATP-binding protein [Conexibacter sp.]
MRTDDAGRGAPTRSLVGRVRELERLLRWIHEALDGAGGAVLVTGEPGVGKSRLLRSAVGELAATRATVLALRADPLDRELPFAGLRDALAAHANDPRLRPLAARLLAAEGAAAAHAAAAHGFAALIRERPLVLACDDLELVDERTLLLAADLLDRPAPHPLVLAGNLRTAPLDPGTTCGRLLERARAAGTLRTLALGPLADDALAELLRRASPQASAPHVAAAVGRGDGNALLALAALRDAIDEAESPDAASERRRRLLDRVLPAPPAARRIAQAVALLGRVGPARMELAAELAGVPDADAAAAFDALVARGLLRRDGDGYRVARQLVHDTLRDQIGPAERWRWHRVAADRLAHLPPSPDVDLELAEHLRAIAEPGDERALALFARIAEHACAEQPCAAIPWFERAVALVPAADVRRASLAARLAHTLLLAGRPREAVAVGREALAGLAPGELRSGLVSVVVGGLMQASELHDAAALLDAELAGASAAPLAAQAAHVQMGVRRRAEAAANADAALRQLREATPADRVLGLVHLTHARYMGSRFDELPGLWDELAAAARQAPAVSQLDAYAAMAYTQGLHAYTREASASIARAQALMAQTGSTLHRPEVATAQVQNAAYLGEWSSALAMTAGIAEELTAAGSLSHRTMLRDIEVEVRAHRGEWAAARREVDRPLASGAHFEAVQAWGRAGIELLTGHPEAARARLVEELDRSPVSSVSVCVRALLLARIAEAEIDAGRPHAAAELLSEPMRQGLDVLNRPTYVAVRLAYGRATGDVDALRDGLAVADDCGLALQRGQGRLLLGSADVAPQRNLTEAARIFGALGAAPWRRRAVAELRRRGLKVPRRRSHASALLSETEAQIARLVQQGARNREIAQTVYLSVKTVEAYLSRIYGKTGCANRLELARAVDAGLLDDESSANVTM